MGSNQEPRIKPVIASEPLTHRQDSSECFKTSCFPFTNSFKEEAKEESTIDDPPESCTLVLTKTQFNDGTLNNQLNSKSLLNADQFVSGIQTERLKMKTLKTGEIVTSTGLILETDDMVNGEVWGDKHDKKDKLNQQVLSSSQMECGQLELEEDKATQARRALREQKLKELGQLDGQFDPIDNTEDDEYMQLDSPLDECLHTKMVFDSNKSLNAASPSLAAFNTPSWLLSLSWDDILYTTLLPMLSMEDIFRLRGTSTGFRTMVDGYFAQLKKLDLTSIGCRFTTKAFKIMTDNNDNLRFLNLTGCKCITNDLVIPVFNRNERLKTVDLSECHHLTDGCLQPLANHCHELKRLVLSNCHWVSRQSIKYLSHKQPNLTTLNITGCWELNDSTLVELIESFRRLEFLSVSNIYSLTDKTMVHIAAYCPSLIALDIRGCWRVSDNGVKRIAEYCKELKLLNIMDCRDVTEASLMRLRKRGVRLDRPVDPLTLRVNRQMGARRGVIPVEALYDEEPLPISLRLQV